MTTNGDCTIYHFDDDKEIYTRQYFDEVHIYYAHEHRQNTSSGATDVSKGIVRIPTWEKLPIFPGDKLVIGWCDSEKPPQEYRSVLLVRDNRRGLNPHWRLEISE